MVNQHAPHGEAALAALRLAAMDATDVSVVISGAGPGSPVLWVNPGFTRTTGWAAADVVGRRPSFLHPRDEDPGPVHLLRDAVRDERPVTATVRNQRRDGTLFWNQVSLSPVRDDAGRLTHWVGIQVDVSDHVELAGGLRRSVQQERRTRRGLTLAVQASDLLTEVEDPFVLREICSLLQREMVRWACFFLEDGGLRPADGVSGSRAGEDPAQDPPPANPAAGTTTASDRAAGEPAVPDPAPPPDDEGRREDPAARLLAGAAGPFELDLAGQPLGPVSDRLRRDVRAALLAHGEPLPDVAVLHPVPGRRGVLGVLVTVPACGDGTDGMGGIGGLEEDDLAVLRLVVRRVGMVVDNARLYAREHRLAETLQRAMLPQQSEVADLDVWTYYAPASGHAQVGGDWYDVLQVAPGHVALVIGDVVGHDVEAAATMGQLRSVVRAYAFQTADPAEVLRRVDHLVAGMRVPRAASLALVTLERDPGTPGGAWRARYARAGHLPPLLVRGDDVVPLREATGLLVGFGADRRTAAETELRPGDLLVLYTDGLVERRDRRMREGVEILQEVAGGVGDQDAAGVGEELLSRLADDPEDDVAMVVVRVPDPQARVAPGSGPRRRRWSLPSEPASIARARQAVVRTCEAWDVEGASSAELVVSELVGNAVMHGWGHVVLRVFDTGDGVRLEVEDANPAPPVPTDGHAGRTGGYGMRIVERLGDWGWRPLGEGKLVWARVRPVPVAQALRELRQDSGSGAGGPGAGPGSG